MRRGLTGARALAIVAAVAWSVASPAAVLLDRTEITTSPATAADGADESIVQFDLGAASTGFAANSRSGTRLADDFVVPAPGWTIEAIEFLAFQPKTRRIAPVFTGVNFRIWNGMPGAPGSVVLFGDTSANRFTGATFGGDYRRGRNARDAARPVFAVRAGGVSFDLAPGTYWVDYQIDGPSRGGPYAPPRVFPDAGANARQFRGADWVALTDEDLAVGLPFRISGNVVGSGGAALDLLFRNGFE